MRAAFVRGNIYVYGPTIDKIGNRFLSKIPSTYSESRIKRDGPSYHLTIVHKRELPTEFDGKAFVEEDVIEDVIPLGVGRVKDDSSEVFFVVIHSLKCCEIRAKVLGTKYTPKDFHITLGFSHQDIHSMPKGLSSLLSPNTESPKEDIGILIRSSWKAVGDRKFMDEHVNVLEHCLQSTDESKIERRARILDVLCALYCAKLNPQVSLGYAQDLADISPERGLVRKCLAYRDLNEPILANFAGIGALRIFWRNNENDNQQYNKTISIIKNILMNLDCPVDSRSLSEQFERYFSSDKNPWRHFSFEDEPALDRFLDRLHKEFVSSQEKEYVSEMATTRRCVFDPLTDTVHRMPRFFSWIIPQRLCGMSTPRNKSDVLALENCLNIGLVVSLTIETPLPEEWFSSNKCKHLFLPVENYMAPSIRQINEFILAATATMLRNKAVLVHCGGGKGRAGTMLACWLVRMGQFGWEEDDNKPLCCVSCMEETQSEGNVFCLNEGCALNRSMIEAMLNKRGWRHEETFTAQEAIDSLRKWRPGSIETQQQENFIHEYASELWKRQSEGCFDTPYDNNDSSEDDSQSVNKPYECAPKFAQSIEKLIVKINQNKAAGTTTTTKANNKTKPSLILTVGLPGSGKSTLGRILAESGKKVTILSGDEMGGKDAVERCLGSAMRAAQADGSIVYVDRCHPTPESRARALSLAFYPNDAWAIFVDVEKDECIKRVNSRLDHPTVEIGSGRGVVETFAKMLVPPECSEGFARVYHVKSLQALNELIENVFGVPSNSSSSANTLTRRNKEEQIEKEGTSNGPQRLPGFTKFPRTPHLVRMGKDSIGRDDLLISDAKTWLLTASKYRIVVEEKVDGANLGISIDPVSFALRVQNRSHYVTSKDHPQFSPLNEWMTIHQFEIRSLLEAAGTLIPMNHNNVNPIMFGEWLVAKHSIHYDALTDYFLAFDLLLPNGRFASRRLFNRLLDEHCPSLARVPILHDSETERIDLETLQKTVTQGQSHFRKDNGKLEGVYIRIDDGDFLKERSKIVRADFISGNDHWTKHSIERNLKIFH